MYIKHLETSRGTDYSSDLKRIADALELISQQLERITSPGFVENTDTMNDQNLNQDTPKEVITVKEAAKILRISLPKMYELASSGKIRSIQVGRRILLSRSSLQEFISGKTATKE